MLELLKEFNKYSEDHIENMHVISLRDSITYATKEITISRSNSSSNRH